MSNQSNRGYSQGKKFVRGKTNKPDTAERFEIFRGMDIKRFNTKIFIIQTEKDFEELKEIEKMGSIIRKCDDSLQQWFYDRGRQNELPKTFKKFKDMLREQVAEAGLLNIFKYKEEQWGSVLSKSRDDGSK